VVVDVGDARDALDFWSSLGNLSHSFLAIGTQSELEIERTAGSLFGMQQFLHLGERHLPHHDRMSESGMAERDRAESLFWVVSHYDVFVAPATIRLRLFVKYVAFK
jgi:hypothetical protein